jgi:hypothetical protein
MRSQKTRIQILLDADDLVYLHKFDDGSEKNPSQVIHELIYSHKTLSESIEKFKTKLIAETQKEKYQDVRNDQIKKAAPDPVPDKWAWLRGNPEDPNLKSSIDDERFKPTKTHKVKK